MRIVDLLRRKCRQIEDVSTAWGYGADDRSTSRSSGRIEARHALHRLCLRRASSALNRVFFVEQSPILEGWRKLTVDEGFTPAQFREARREDGKLGFYPADEATKLIADLPVVEVPE